MKNCKYCGVCSSPTYISSNRPLPEIISRQRFVPLYPLVRYDFAHLNPGKDLESYQCPATGTYFQGVEVMREYDFAHLNPGKDFVFVKNVYNPPGSNLAGRRFRVRSVDLGSACLRTEVFLELLEVTARTTGR